MTPFELAKKALKNIGHHSFPCNIYASEGGACGYGWDDIGELELWPDQIRYLLSERIDNNELFKELGLEEVDVDDILTEMAKDGAWPDGGASGSVKNTIPDELSGLEEELDSLFYHDNNDAATINGIREKLLAIKDGDYTFHFNVTDPEDTYYFSEDAEVEIHLTAKEVLGLINGQYALEMYFDDIDGIDDNILDDDFLNDKAAEMDIASGYDNFTYRGGSEALDGFLNAWVCIIKKILSGEITEDTLPSWTAFFDDPDNFDDDICFWHEYED